MDYKNIIKNFLDENDRLKTFPAKRKLKVYSLYYLADKLERGKVYSESELNDLLNSWHTFYDPATLRREMYNNKFIDRNGHNGTYWLEEMLPDVDEIMKKLG